MSDVWSKRRDEKRRERKRESESEKERESEENNITTTTHLIACIPLVSYPGGKIVTDGRVCCSIAALIS